jgi:gamma-glutamylcyclotransferase (GGCT)/AIG2-like uncharacterized protein YtfP
MKKHPTLGCFFMVKRKMLYYPRMRMRHEKLFVFGTLRWKRFRKTAFGKIVAGTRGLLRDHKRVDIVINGEPYGAIIPQRGKVVHGLVFSVTERELRRCDRYEARYERRRVRLHNGDTAWVYAMRMY